MSQSGQAVSSTITSTHLGSSLSGRYHRQCVGARVKASLHGWRRRHRQGTQAPQRPDRSGDSARALHTSTGQLTSVSPHAVTRSDRAPALVFPPTWCGTCPLAARPAAGGYPSPCWGCRRGATPAKEARGSRTASAQSARCGADSECWLVMRTRVLPSATRTPSSSVRRALASLHSLTSFATVASCRCPNRSSLLAS